MCNRVLLPSHFAHAEGEIRICVSALCAFFALARVTARVPAEKRAAAAQDTRYPKIADDAVAWTRPHTFVTFGVYRTLPAAAPEDQAH